MINSMFFILLFIINSKTSSCYVFTAFQSPSFKRVYETVKQHTQISTILYISLVITFPIYIYIYTYTHIYIYLYIYIYRERERQTEWGKKERERGRVAYDEMATVVGNGHRGTSSNPGRNCLHFT